MEKVIYLNNQKTHYTIDDVGRLKNINNQNYLKGAINKGYHFYNIYFKGKQYTLYTHRLVAEYFLDNPDSLPIVHHIDGNKLNNLVSNLQWIDTEKHQSTIDFNGLGAGQRRQYFCIDEMDEQIAQFRNSPYYATVSGHVLNMQKKILMREESSGAYRRVQCYYNLNGKHFSVHRLVWEAFNGPIPEGYEINHIDNNPSNNALNNLELVTHIKNCEKAKHNQKKVKAVSQEGKELHFSSISLASKEILGYRDGRAIPKAIENHSLLKGYYWYYEE